MTRPFQPHNHHMKKEKPTRGGKREGAGRKPRDSEAQITRSVSMIPAAWEILDEQRGEISRGDHVHKLLVKEQKRNNRRKD